MSKRNGPTFCWVCNRNLMIATTGEWKGHRVWSVVVDQRMPLVDQLEHRVHKQCVPGYFHIRDDIDREMAPIKLKVFS